MRYFIQFSYFGTAYHGWQYQPNAVTVQEVLEQALSTLLKGKIALMGAGRTDAGVHAKQMYAHFDIKSIEDTKALVQKLNSFLPSDIAVQSIFAVIDEAHARFDATQRTYEYWIVQRKDPFLYPFAHYVRKELDVDTMNTAAKVLLGKKDFECFSKSNSDVHTFFCDLTKAVWEQKEEKLVFTITADRFLRNMVRAVVGTLLDVGTAKKKIVEINEILESRDRSRAGASVPAKGLYLTQVLYPKEIISKIE